MTENRYNLLDEAWIPIADMGKAGLLRVFGGRECRALGGTAVQKIAVLKLLIAIAQAAATPQDTQEWAAMGPDGLGERCTAYLKLWRNAFWLYGDKPFLQMPACSKAELKPYGTAMPQVASGNTTLLTQLQLEPARCCWWNRWDLASAERRRTTALFSARDTRKARAQSPALPYAIWACSILFFWGIRSLKPSG